MLMVMAQMMMTYELAKCKKRVKIHHVKTLGTFLALLYTKPCAFQPTSCLSPCFIVESSAEIFYFVHNLCPKFSIDVLVFYSVFLIFHINFQRMVAAVLIIILWCKRSPSVPRNFCEWKGSLVISIIGLLESQYGIRG